MSNFWPAAFGLSTGLWLEWWKSDRKNLTDLCNSFCQAVTDSAEAGAKFWLSSPADSQAPILFARLTSFQERIAGYNVILIGRFHPDDITEIDNRLAELFAELTGGDPEDPNRQASIGRAIAVYDKANAVTIALRTAEFTRLNFVERASRWVSHTWPNQK